MPCFGEKYKMEMDHLAPQREELAKFKKTLEVLKRTVETFEINLAHLKPAHDELSRNIEKSYPQHVHETLLGERVFRQVDLLSNHVKLAFDNTKPEYLLMKAKLDRITTDITHCENRLKDRDKAYSPKVHYEKKLALMKARSSLAGGEKIDRNLRKHSAAANKWQELDENTSKELHRLLEDRYVVIAQLVDMHSRHLVAFYDICLDQLPPVIPKTQDVEAVPRQTSAPPVQSLPDSPEEEKPSSSDIIFPKDDEVVENKEQVKESPPPQQVIVE
jgi:hypothetical protein